MRYGAQGLPGDVTGGIVVTDWIRSGHGIDRSLNSRNLERTGLLDIQHFRTLVLLSDLSRMSLR